MTPVQRPQSSSETLRMNYLANMQAQAGAQNMQASQQPMQGMPLNGNWQAGMVQPSPSQAMPVQYNHPQMHTPPPTRGTSVKKPQPIQNVAFGTPSTIASRRFMTPQQQQQQPEMQAPLPMPQQQTPMQFPMLQFSPEMQHFGNMGPATAPVQLQTRNFWEAQASPALGQPIMLDDPFGLNATQQDHLTWTPNPSMPAQTTQTVSFDTPAMDSFPIQQPHPRPATAAPTAMPSVSAAQPSYPVTSASVDPSLLYSSPMRPLPIVRSNGRADKVRPTMEQVDNKRRDSAATVGSTSTNAASTGSTISRPGSSLRRSNTTGTARPWSANSSITPMEAQSRSNSITQQVPRTASPLKRVGKAPLDPISEGAKPRLQRASVMLTIDENGRARTVTKNPERASPTKSMQERYPGLFDSDSSDDDSDSSAEPASRNASASFSFTKGEERRTKAARLDAPLENLEGLNLPRSNSSASLRVTPSRAAVAAAANLKRYGSLKKPGTSRARKPLTKSSSSSSMIDTCPMDFGDQASIGVESTPSLSPEDSSSLGAPPAFYNTTFAQAQSTTIDAHNNRRWSMLPQHPRQQHQQQQIRIRCPCGSTSHTTGEPLVQCKSCTQYQHPLCVNVDLSFGVPPSYTCFLCTMPTEGRRT